MIQLQRITLRRNSKTYNLNCKRLYKNSEAMNEAIKPLLRKYEIGALKHQEIEKVDYENLTKKEMKYFKLAL